MNFLKISITTLIIAVLSLLSFQPVITNAAYSNRNIKKHSDTILHIKFAETDEVRLSNNQFVSTTGKDLSQVNELLGSNNIAKKSRLFTASPDEIGRQRQELHTKSNAYVPKLNNYYSLVLNQGIDIDDFAGTVKQLPGIIEAYAQPLPVKSPTSPDFTNLQTHFNAAPNGMGITSSSIYPGSLGDRIKIADLEYSWNTSHEDISDSRQTDTLIQNGTPADPWNDNNHGTGVLGIFSGDRNSYGVNGIVPNSKLHLVNTYSNDLGWNISNAINLAQTKLTAGDVMLIEQQTWGPEGRGIMPVEWVPEIYDSIKVATAKGIIVVEAAGNGAENLDDPIFGTTFPQGKADSGAIIVGAGSACNGTDKHSRMNFSNYGRRINVQGYGECVVTAGYGNLYSGVGANTWYTSNFNGTSSAAALVAALAGSISSSYEYQNEVNLTPLQIRNLLISTGTPQDMTIPGNIGPLPNLESALRSFTDNVSPTVPTNIRARLTNQNKVSLSWDSSTDNSGKVTYKIYRNNVLIASTANTTYIDLSVRRKTSYSYKVQATDPSGNISSFSSSVSIRTR